MEVQGVAKRLYVTTPIGLITDQVHWTKYLKIFWIYQLFLIGEAKHLVDDIDVNICTHVIYSFAVLNPTTYEMKVFDSWLDLDLNNYANFVGLKSKNPNVKLIIALGGWTDSQNNANAYKTMFADSAKRLNFAK